MECSCDAVARAWSMRILVLNGSAFIGAMVLVVLQMWVALFLDKEVWHGDLLLHFTSWGRDWISNCLLRKGTHSDDIHLISSGSLPCYAIEYCLLIIPRYQVALGTGSIELLHEITLQSPLTIEDASKNFNLMQSWALMAILMAFVAMYTSSCP